MCAPLLCLASFHQESGAPLLGYAGQARSRKMGRRGVRVAHMHVHMCAHVCVHVCVCMCMYTYMYTCIGVSIYLPIYLSICGYSPPCANSRKMTKMCVYIYIYIYIYMCVSLSLSLSRYTCIYIYIYICTHNIHYTCFRGVRESGSRCRPARRPALRL